MFDSLPEIASMLARGDPAARLLLSQSRDDVAAPMKLAEFIFERRELSPAWSWWAVSASQHLGRTKYVRQLLNAAASGGIIDASGWLGAVIQREGRKAEGVRMVHRASIEAPLSCDLLATLLTREGLPVPRDLIARGAAAGCPICLWLLAADRMKRDPAAARRLLLRSEKVFEQWESVRCFTSILPGRTLVRSTRAHTELDADAAAFLADAPREWKISRIDRCCFRVFQLYAVP
jgi:hypothetical protein